MEDRIGKARHERAADFAVQDRARLRVLADLIQALPDLHEEFSAEARAFCFVPFKGGAEILLGPCAKHEPPRHEPRRIRAKASSGAIPESGSASSSARRRSSSSLC